jgi:hypothetical protein
MKLHRRAILGALLALAYVMAYVAWRSFCLAQTLNFPMLSAADSSRMTPEDDRRMMEAHLTSRPIDYDFGVVNGILRVLFFPAAVTDRAITGRGSTFGGWMMRPYAIPGRQSPEQPPAR